MSIIRVRGASSSPDEHGVEHVLELGLDAHLHRRRHVAPSVIIASQWPRGRRTQETATHPAKVRMG